MEIYKNTYDVIVAGGGVSGSAAAISAARAGASTLLIEQSGYLGGTLTSCGVGPMMTFFAGEKQVIKGLMQEIVDRLIKKGYSRGHVYDTTRYISYTTPFDAEGLKLILDEMTEEAGVTTLFHTKVGGVSRDGSRISGLHVCNKDGIRQVQGNVYIDATGDGDLTEWSGEETSKGRAEDGAAQPLTMKMKFSKVDTDRLKTYIKQHPDDFPRLRDNLDLVDTKAPLALAGFDSQFRTAKQKGEISIPREDILMFETWNPGEFIINTTRVLNCDAVSAADLSTAEREGRRQCEELARFMRRYVPGFEHALLEFTGPSIGIRSSRQLIGRYVMSAEDILTGRRFSSAIAHSGYPIDIHSPDGEGTKTHYIGEGGGRTYYDIPYEIMVPKHIKNLLVTGRCVSASFEAQASIRLTPSAGAMGQAAGIAAAIASKHDCYVGEIEVAGLQQQLREHGAYLEC